MGDELYLLVQEKNFVSLAKDRTRPPNFCTNVSQHATQDILLRNIIPLLDVLRSALSWQPNSCHFIHTVTLRILIKRTLSSLFAQNWIKLWDYAIVVKRFWLSNTNTVLMKYGANCIMFKMYLDEIWINFIQLKRLTN